jgi:hypothetical protein
MARFSSESRAMTQLQLEEAVARVTGESLATIQRLGFQLQAEPPDHDLEPEDLHLAVACPFCGGSCALPEGPLVPDLLAECDHCDIYFDFQVDDIYAAGPEAIGHASARPPGEIAA